MRAEVKADGTLAVAGRQGSIHRLGAEMQGKAACNGWTFWHYEVEGVRKPIDALRERSAPPTRPRARTSAASSPRSEPEALPAPLDGAGQGGGVTNARARVAGLSPPPPTPPRKGEAEPVRQLSPHIVAPICQGTNSLSP